jgi:hypothetical protein
MQRLKTALTALLIGLVLVTSVDYVAFAATGKSVILGEVNKANKKTVIKNTASGPAAKFVSQSGPAIRVSNTAKIPSLNSDLLDGLDSTAFLRSNGNAASATNANNANLLDGLDSTAFAPAAMAPIAFGFVNGAGTLVSGRNVGAVSRTSAGTYNITIPGQNYFYSSFVTNVTTTCDSFSSNTDSLGGHLLVETRDGTNTLADCTAGFAFTVFKP